MSPDLLDIFARALTGIGWVFLPILLLPALALFIPHWRSAESVMRALISFIDDCNNLIGELVKWLLPALVCVVAFGVIALSIFGQSWTKLDESAIYFHAITIMLGSGATLLAGGHVRVDLLHSKFSPAGKALTDFAGFYALMVPFCLVILWNSQSIVAMSWRSFEGSAESDGIQGVFFLKTLIPVFAILLLAQGMAIAGRAALVMTDKDEPSRPPNIPPLFGGGNESETGL